MIFLDIAFGNLVRNRRRTLITLGAIVSGIALMVFVNGFSDGLSKQWADSIINEKNGHLQIHHKDFYKYGISDQEKVLISDPGSLVEELCRNPRVVSVMPRVSFAGMIGTENTMATFYGAAGDLSRLDATLPGHGKRVVAGSALSANDPDGIVIGKALAQSMGVGVGDELVVLSRTVGGDQSSTLVHIRGLIYDPNNPVEEYAAVFGGLSDPIRRDLLDIGQGATELIVRLDDTGNVPAVTQWITQRVAGRSEPLVVEPWNSNKEFKILTGLFNTIRIGILIALSVMVSFIISSTLMMTIFERTQETGSMRAVGLEKTGVYALFFIEYLMMILSGGSAGLALGSAFVMLGQHTGVTLAGGWFEGVRPVLSWGNLAVSFGVPFVVAAVVAAFPIYLSSKMSVIEALTFQ